MKIKSLYFENSNGEWREIAKCARCDVGKHINEFIANANANKPDGKKFVSYYTRTWTDGGFEHFDVGSHTEFFHWGNKKND